MYTYIYTYAQRSFCFLIYFLSLFSEIDLLQTVVPSTNQLIDLSLDPQDNNINFNNNNSLLTTTNTLVTADSHENKGMFFTV